MVAAPEPKAEAGREPLEKRAPLLPTKMEGKAPGPPQLVDETQMCSKDAARGRGLPVVALVSMLNQDAIERNSESAALGIDPDEQTLHGVATTGNDHVLTVHDLGVTGGRTLSPGGRPREHE